MMMLEYFECLVNALNDINDVFHRRLIVIKQINRTIDNKNLRSYGLHIFQQSFSDGDIQLIAGECPANESPIKKICRCKALVSCKLGKELRIDPIGSIDEYHRTLVFYDL